MVSWCHWIVFLLLFLLNILTVLSKLGLLKKMRLRRAQMRECMGIGYWTSRACSASTRGHSTHHRTGLADLGPSRHRNPGVHLRDHASTWMNGIRMLSVGHRMAWRQTRMLRNALMGRERLRHHHR